ncbi:class I SAM-dependent methyltransferase [Bacillus sonorensis]|uniref:class I SAM-dependent methyltransferase n=1 Tax=Bacillus TaxID=1386 RepID=UPI00049555FB|nr:class I SAM-dependent methyltransferase [Bacillus sonorensis]MBG9916020.1 SAM-dependent methyltransferase [Bacillus sonorensis]MCF7617553.1 class I SAM-dependent methyltransferase [Bacillus sonorensis]MCY7856269.1 class I SAM-dependent methyltransferase [Bacillus sonorensis]MCY8026006.1 class I SAM-dependent methyltransferase [Bacillus sonorensis]MCY8035006.1 class I SAM-dependent methyltransferase [Bacillus sonorensis]
MFEQWLGKQLRSPRGILSKWVASYMETGNHDINEWTIQLLDIQPYDRILEIGTGGGAALSRIAEKLESGRACGIDSSKSMIKQSLRRTERLREEGKAEIKYGRAENIPFADRSFHKVFSVHTVYFWTDARQALKEIYRVLQIDGTLYLSVHLKEQIKLSKKTKDFTLYTEEQIRDLLEKNRFREINVHMYKNYCCITAVK